MKASTCEEPSVAQLKESIRVEDKMRLRELELQTQYEVKYLSDSFEDLKKLVVEGREKDHNNFEQINKKVTWLWLLFIAQWAGADVPMLLTLIKTLGT